jgi:hypothetical protein
MAGIIGSADVSALNDFINEYSPDIAQEYLIGAEFANQITLDLNVTSKKAYEKIVVTPSLKPFTGDFNAEINKIKFTERLITVEVLQDDYTFNAEQFRKKFIGMGYDITKGEIPLFQMQLEAIMKKNVSIINTEILYNSSTALVATPTNGYLRQVDGLGKQIDDLIADPLSGIVVRPTGALTGGSGWSNAVASFGNIIDKIDMMDEATPLQLANEPRSAYMSYDNYWKYVDEYKRRFPLGNAFTNIVGAGGFFTDRSKGLLKLEPCRWMGNSQRVFITPRKNIVFGTDIQSPDFSVFNSQNRVYTLDLGFKYVYGMLIIDPAAMIVNELV